MKKNFELFKQLFPAYIGFKSISTDSAYAGDILKQVEWLGSLFAENGFRVEILKGPNTNPVVFAEHHISNDLKTVLIYGHYDVQPADMEKEKGWKADPFILREENGRYIGRGAVDNKGQNLIHIATAITLIEEGRLGCNLKFLIEGNEETGNDDLAGLVTKYSDFLSSDEIIISDGEIAGDTPTIEETLRGGGNLTLTYKTSENDLHSGLYGSGVPSSAKELVSLLSKMLLPDGTVTIPGFYDSVDAITPEQTRRNLALLDISNPVEAGTVKALIGEHDFHTMVGIWPAVEISGITSGYTGTGYKNIIPGTATAKINFRLVASQKPETFVELFEKYVKDNTPDYVDYAVKVDKMYNPVKVSVDSPTVQRIMELQEKIYGVKPVIKNVGGGSPVVADFKTILGADAILLSLGNDDCNMHGTEENFRMDLIEKGLMLSEQLLAVPQDTEDEEEEIPAVETTVENGGE